MDLAELKAAIDGYNEAAARGFKTAAADIAGLLDRLEELEAKAGTPGNPRRDPKGAEAREHKARFESWIRKPHDSQTKQSLGDFESKMETKVLSAGTAADGGFAMPEEISRDIERLEKKLSPVRDLVKVVRTGTGDYKALVNIRGSTSGWVSETGTRSETVTPKLRERAPSWGELYAYPQTTEWALDDIFFDIGAWLAEEVADQFALAEGSAVISGTGTDQPTGLLNTTPVTTADFASPLRSAEALQYIASDLTPGGVNVIPDALIDTVYTCNARYRANATWAMNSLTAAAIRKLKDTTNQYLWAPVAAGQPDRLLGYPVAIWEQVPDIGANNFCVLFGDFRRGYVLAERSAIRITVDANITTPGRIKYFVRRREGGRILNNDAIKVVRTL